MNNTQIKIIRHCPFCDKTHEIQVDKYQYLEAKKKLNQGFNFEKSFSFFSTQEKEFISRGLCGLCYGKVFPKY